MRTRQSVDVVSIPTKTAVEIVTTFLKEVLSICINGLRILIPHLLFHHFLLILTRFDDLMAVTMRTDEIIDAVPTIVNPIVVHIITRICNILTNRVLRISMTVMPVMAVVMNTGVPHLIVIHAPIISRSNMNDIMIVEVTVIVIVTVTVTAVPLKTSNTSLLITIAHPIHPT